MNFINVIYYYLEGSGLYLQNKIWGRYYNESAGYRFVSLTTIILVFSLGYIATQHLHFMIVICVVLLPLICWGTYLFSGISNRSSDHKIKDFNQLKPFTRWAYLIYTSTVMIILPLLIIVLLILKGIDAI
ncbi:MAG: hypothetical protein EOO43_05815 [Flavobacterium sp.]|nr:MAG: hypothetical protein EOO43_05815 [Flavobacterium sp.]